MFRFPLFCLLFLPVLLAAAPDESRYIRLSGELSPAVELAVERKENDLELTLRAVNPYAGLSGRLLAARSTSKLFRLEKFPATLMLKESELGSGPLRLGIELEWSNANGSLRQREIFLADAVGGKLSSDPAFAHIFDFEEYERAAADRKQRILLDVKLDKPGKITLVLEDAKGNRIRNLVSGISYPAGTHKIEWDGRDESGNRVAPGRYKVHTLTHPGLAYDFLMQFNNGNESFFTPWGTNHGTMTAFADNGQLVFALSPLTEGGHSMVALTPEGKFVRAYRQIHGTGIATVFGAADEKILYTFHDGPAFASSAKPRLSLTRYEVATGRVLPTDGRNFVTLHERAEKASGLAGAALFDGLLYVSYKTTNEIFVVQPEDGKIVRKISCPDPGLLAVDSNKLYIVTGTAVNELAGDALRKIFTLDYAPRGFAARNGMFYFSGASDSTLRIHDISGRAAGSLGEPGGDYVGKWEPERLVHPLGLIVRGDGSLWSTEKRRNPKRITRWDLAQKKVVYEKFGTPSYGSPAAGFDPENPGLWIGDGCLWRIDEKTHNAEILRVLLPPGGHMGIGGFARTYQVVRRAGRTFVIGQDMMTTFSELLPDGTLKDLAGVGTPGIFGHSIGRKQIPALEEALGKAFPELSPEKRRREESFLMLWVDKNGNGTFDADEFEFSPNGSFGEVGYWGFQPADLDFTIFYQDEKKKNRILNFRADSFNGCGAPAYSLKEAIASSVPIQSEFPPGTGGLRSNSYSDPWGNTFINTSPNMFAFGADGQMKWFFRNMWSNVHGSQKAPMPRPGEIQGQLFTLGIAPLDARHGVMALMGNHGRIFFITTDGFYIDELFSDCRVSELIGPGLIGGEPFGGMFQFDRKNKRYLLQGGNSGYRIYRIENLDKLHRSEWMITLDAPAIEAATRLNPVEVPGARQIRTAVIPFEEKVEIRKIWQTPEVAAWARADWKISLRARYDRNNLYLLYQVRDTSPWVNNGSVWSSLFKTGDAVDFQFALEPVSDRRNAAPGDLRILAAPMEGGANVAVLYRYKVAGDKAGLAPMEFNSPWRSMTCDDVRRSSAKVETRVQSEHYDVTLTIPLAELGLSYETARGRSFCGDFGVIYGDRAGTVNLARIYWSNQETGLVNDVPGEMIPQPRNWGNIQFGE